MKSANTVSIILLFSGVFFFTSCSGIVRSGGRYEAEFFHDVATTSTIRQQLGKPVSTQTFSPPMLLKDAPELVRYRDFLRGPSDMLAGFREDFRYRGWLREPGDNVGYAMFVGTTAGVGEIIAFPTSIVERVKDSVTAHTFQVWCPHDTKTNKGL